MSRTHCRTHGGARGVHDNSGDGCEWVPVPDLTEQEWEIIEAIRHRDGRRDGDLARCFGSWARGSLRILFDPPDRPEVELAIRCANLRRGVGGFGRPLRPLLLATGTQPRRAFHAFWALAAFGESSGPSRLDSFSWCRIPPVRLAWWIPRLRAQCSSRRVAMAIPLIVAEG